MRRRIEGARRATTWLAVPALLVGCASGGATSSAGGAPAVAPAAATANVGVERTLNAQEAAARIAQLKRSFDCVSVGTAGDFVCSMKDGVVGSLVRKRIEPVVTSRGTLFLRSIYRDRDWIYHDHVIVRIGEEELRTAPLPATSRDVSRRTIQRTSSLGERNRNRRQDDDYVSEAVSYRGNDGDAIIRAIVRAGSANVTMQLAGGPRVFDKTLSDDEKRLFREAAELATLLRGQP